jgi:hypothetical protein
MKQERIDHLRRFAKRAHEWANEAEALPNPSAKLLRMARDKRAAARHWEWEADVAEGKAESHPLR